jgi:ATP-dependent Clp protease protease subunit
MDEQTLIGFEQISLESLGTFMLFGQVETNQAYAACNFILKANMLNHVDQLNFIINTEGGSVSDGFAIVDAIVHSRLPVHTTASGLLASMGLLIACAGNKGTRKITRNTEIMAHQFYGGMEGKYHELVAINKRNEMLAKKFITYFKKHSTMNEKQIKDIVFAQSDRFLTAHECKKYGLCDQVVDYIY